MLNKIFFAAAVLFFLSVNFVCASNFAFNVNITGNFSEDSLLFAEDYNIQDLQIERVFLHEFDYDFMLEDDFYNDTIKIQTLDSERNVLDEVYSIPFFEGSNLTQKVIYVPFETTRYVKFFNAGRELLEFDTNELCNYDSSCSGLENVYFCSDCTNSSLDGVCTSYGNFDSICDPDCRDEDCVNSIIDEESNAYCEGNCLDFERGHDGDWQSVVADTGGDRSCGEQYGTCTNNGTAVVEEFNWNNNFWNAGVVLKTKYEIRLNGKWELYC